MRGQVKKRGSQHIRAGNKGRGSFRKGIGWRIGRRCSETTRGGRKVGVGHLPEDKGITDQSQGTYSRKFVQLEADVEEIFDQFRAKFADASQIRARAKKKSKRGSKRGGKKGGKQRKKNKRQRHERRKWCKSRTEERVDSFL